MKKLNIFLVAIIFFLLIRNVWALELEKITVDIKGAVNYPGVYELDAGTTVYDLIGKAGGLKTYADTSLINLSKRLSDQDVVIVYTMEEVRTMTKGDTSIKVVDKECICPKIENVSCINKKSSTININKASIEELQKLSGIGKSKAEAIIEYRNKTPFIKKEDIMNVKGIGKALYEKNKDNIGV